MRTTEKLFLVSALALGFLLTACEKNKLAGSGGFDVAMTDAPADYSSLDVEIVGVSAYSETAGWVDLSSKVQTVNILSLTNGREIRLTSDAKVEAGNYTKVKITFGNNNRVRLTGHAAVALGGMSGVLDVNLNYAGPREVVVEIDHNVEAEASSSLLIDFHAAESVVDSAGQYYLRPVITQIHDRFTGIRGRLSASARAHVMARSRAGSAVFSTYVDAEGNFLIRDMTAGAYDLVIQKASEAGSTPPPAVTVENITVVKGEIKSLGTVTI